MSSCHSPEALAAELVAIADRVGADGSPVYSKADIREGLPLLVAAACPPDSAIAIPVEVRELLKSSGALSPSAAGPFSRAQLGEIIGRHYQRVELQSDFVAQLQACIRGMCDQERRDRLDRSQYRDLLGIAPPPRAETSDGDAVRAGPLLRAQLSR